MNLEKLFGSKTKVDILKYLLFRRQGVSMRALESELDWTFPAIKKQVDSLKTAGAIEIDKDSMKWSITIKPDFIENIRNLFFYSLKGDLKNLFDEYEVMIDQYYFGKVFDVDIDMDLVVIYKNCDKPLTDKIKESISDIFRSYHIEEV